MSQAVTGPVATVLRRWSSRWTTDVGTAAVLAAAGCCARLGVPWGAWAGLAGIVVAAVWLTLRFPRSADPEDLRESGYRATGLGRRLGIDTGFGGLGRHGGLRMATAALVLPVAAARSAGTAELVIVAVGVAGLLLTIAIEPFVVRLLRLPTGYVAGLPGLPRLPDRIGWVWALAPAGLLAAVLAGLTVAAGGPAWLVPVIAIAAAAPIGWAVRQVRQRRRVAARLRRALPEAVSRFAPAFVLYTARPDDASYQLRMWLPYLRRVGRPFMIVTREELPAEAITPDAGVPVVCCRSVADLDLIMTDSLRAAFYVNASSGNGALIRYHQLTHVYLGHGDSDKPPSYNPTHAMYDQIFTAGPAANRRYAEHGVLIDPAKFRVVGRPQVEVITPAAPDRIAARLAGAPPVVLYAPTWRGHVTETALGSLDRGERLVDALLQRGAEVIFRPHPFSYDDPDDAAIIGRIQDRLAADARRTGRGHVFGAAAETALDAFGCMNAADVMISDVSSVVSDFLFSGKPMAMVAPHWLPVERFAAEYPVAAAAYGIDHDLESLPAVLEELLAVPEDRLAPTRAAIRDDYLGDAPVDGYVEVFLDAVRQACDVPPPQVAEVAESDDGSVAVSRDTVRRNLVTMTQTMIAAVAATLALVGVLGGGALLWAGAAGAVIAAVLLLRAARGHAGEPTPDGPVLVLLLSAGIGLVGGDMVGYLAGLGVLIMIVAGSSAAGVREAGEQPGVVASGLPELVVPRPSGVSARPGLPAVAAAVVGWLLTVVAATSAIPVGWILLPTAAGYAILMIMALRAARSRLMAALRAEASVPAVLARFGPEFCVYFGSGIGAGYQIGMWLPYFRRLGRRFVIITRSLPMQEEISALTRDAGVPVLFRPTLRSLEDVVVPGLKVAFYVNNAVRNTHLIERRELTHVWLNHGDSEKPACFNPVHAIYDVIFAAGQAGIDRYARHGVTIPRQKFRIVGRPQTEAIVPADDVDHGQPPPTVLYAPTWQGPYADSRVYSLPLGRQIVTALLERGATVIFRAHPFNYRFAADRESIDQIGALLAEDRARTGRQHRWGPAAEQELTVEECFNASDAMITDVSAMISDYLASGKPFGVVAVGRSEQELIVEAPAAAAGYPIADDLSDLDQALDRLLITDPAAEDRRRMADYYLGGFRGAHAADGFLTAAAELLGSASTDRRSAGAGAA